MFDVIIIGAGASGLYAAKEIKKKKVLILEKNDRVGFKLSITGKTQCNYTHAGQIKDFYDKYGTNKKFVKEGLYSHKNTDVIDYFESRGVASLVREDGKVFPRSLDSNDIVETLLGDAKKNAIIKLSESVSNILRNDDEFIVQTSKDSYRAKNVIVATGGMSYPVTGSTGDGYKLLERLGHKIIKPRPALTPVYVKNFRLVDVAGISFESIEITRKSSDSSVSKFTGDVLITHKGLSGPAIIDNSRYFKVLDLLELNLVSKTIREVDTMLIKYISENGKKQASSLVEIFDIPRRVFELLLIESDIKKDTKLSEISKLKRKNIAVNLSSYKCEISSLGDYRIAMITSGGVDISQVNPKTMQSKKLDGLYILGELLDIDANTGGYNLQWAFSSAYLAAKNINKM
ncbi:MAG: NAD(P)/FAD-dependent oxidoreductase [Acidaminobacteraceae bacterium]